MRPCISCQPGAGTSAEHLSSVYTYNAACMLCAVAKRKKTEHLHLSYTIALFCKEQCSQTCTAGKRAANKRDNKYHWTDVVDTLTRNVYERRRKVF